MSIDIYRRRKIHPLVIGLPEDFCWDYDSNELIADGAVHGCGIALAAAGVAALGHFAKPDTDFGTFAVVIYAAALVTTLSISALYNLWPISPRKWLLRRFDHAAIYGLIAATSMALLAQVGPGLLRDATLCLIWLGALAGASFKLWLPGRWERASVGSYFLLGGAGLFAAWWWGGLPEEVLGWAMFGSLLYAVGAVFHLSQHLRFHNATWHAFVLLGASCHYVAILTYLSAVPQ